MIFCPLLGQPLQMFYHMFDCVFYVEYKGYFSAYKVWNKKNGVVKSFIGATTHWTIVYVNQSQFDSDLCIDFIVRCISIVYLSFRDHKCCSFQHELQIKSSK